LFWHRSERVVHVAASTYFVMNDAEVNFDQSIFQGFIDFERLYELVVGVVFYFYSYNLSLRQSA
jgi:hypothetical protein